MKKMDSVFQTNFIEIIDEQSVSVQIFEDKQRPVLWTDRKIVSFSYIYMSTLATEIARKGITPYSANPCNQFANEKDL